METLVGTKLAPATALLGDYHSHGSGLENCEPVGGQNVGERILVVDDNHDAADALAKLIQSFGYEARAVYGGKQAVEETVSFQPDMALLDIGMPDLDGYATVQELRQRRGQVHLIVVAVTGHNSDEDKRHAYESGFDLHVAKPMDVKTLKELLRLVDPEHENSAA